MKKYLLIILVIVFAGGLVWFGTLDQEAQDGLLDPAPQSQPVAAPETPQAQPSQADKATAQQPDIKAVASVYEGILPAADCPGIQTTLTLYKDGSFQLNEVYLERDTAFTQQGTFQLEDDLLTLFVQEDSPRYFRLEDNSAVMLNADRQPITGDLASQYILRKK